MPTFDLGYPPSRHRSTRPGYDGTSLQAFFAEFPDDNACLAHVFRQRFGSDPQCPRCGGTGRWRRHEVQKHYFHPCGGILSPMAGTVFSRSHIPLQLWFYAMLHFANSAEGMAGPFMARQLGISEPTAFRMGQRIRAHMAAIDEQCLIGGAGKMVAAKLVKILRITNTRKNVQNSATVLLLSDANRVRATVVSRPSQKCLRAIIEKQVRSRSRLMTDCFWSFRVLSNYSSGRPIAEFVPDYFMDRSPHENLNHGFWQYLNLSFADQYRGVTLDKAWLYLKDYEFRYNRRTRSAETFREMTSSFPLLDEKCLRRIRAASFVEA